MVVELDNTTRCPTGPSCAGCGTGARDTELTVVTAGTSVGVLCVSLCPTCIDRGRAPKLAPTAAVRAVLDHCDHLGCDADEMAAAMNSGWDW